MLWFRVIAKILFNSKGVLNIFLTSLNETFPKETGIRAVKSDKRRDKLGLRDNANAHYLDPVCLSRLKKEILKMSLKQKMFIYFFFKMNINFRSRKSAPFTRLDFSQIYQNNSPYLYFMFKKRKNLIFALIKKEVITNSKQNAFSGSPGIRTIF